MVIYHKEMMMMNYEMMEKIVDYIMKTIQKKQMQKLTKVDFVGGGVVVVAVAVFFLL